MLAHGSTVRAGAGEPDFFGGGEQARSPGREDLAQGLGKLAHQQLLHGLKLSPAGFQLFARSGPLRDRERSPKGTVSRCACAILFQIRRRISLTKGG